MSDLFNVFFQNILPIFTVAAMGFALRLGLGVDKRALSNLSFYVLSPALVFSSLVTTRLGGDELIQLATFAIIMTLSMGLIAFGAGKLLRLPRIDISALILVVMIANTGNYGLTFNELRFGSEGLARAIVYWVVSTMLVFTLGVFVASMGRANSRESLKRLVKLPAFYAVILSIVVYAFSISIPDPLMRGIELAGSGAIPVMLIVLGMQIADIRGLGRVWLAVPASILRLLVAPLVAVLIASFLGLQGLSRSTAIIEASMPTAVITTIMATEFMVRPALVTSTVVLTTLLSAITLPLVIILLGL
ncbi:MAG TPA: AEC family transporter [Patescibacteria group bacterium]|nr:AEC family transporter [Patescibacteria group bacterium]